MSARLANALIALAGVPAAARFGHALARPAEVQARLLRRLVAANAGTAFGHAHGFGDIRSVADYRRRVPVRTFDELRGWVDRVEAGEARVLTAAPVRWLEPSGGSSGASKLVPYTAALLAEFAAATLPWLVDLARARPRLRAGTAYWAISPPVARPAATRGGVRIGMDGDADYFPRVLRPLLSRAQAVPSTVAAAGDLDGCRRATLRALLAADDLALISVWSPSFLTLLADALDADWPALRSAVARPLPASPPTDLGELWPRLDLISCWGDAHAFRALPALRRRFPHVDVQRKGLLATEGVVSIPLHAAPAPVAAVTSHVLEFLAPGGNGDESQLLGELDVGGTYEVVLSTGGGLFRYRLGDLVRVEGRLRATPLLRFVGRADGRSDLAGEKLSPPFVEAAMAAAGVCGFALLAPHPDRGGYVLYAQEPRPAALDAALCAAHHYRLARELGQLRAVEGRAVRDGERAWEAARVAAGQRAGAVKPPVLHHEPVEEAFAPCRAHH